MTTDSKSSSSSQVRGKVPCASPWPNLKPSDLMQRILPEELFLGILCLERKRAERSGKRFCLVLLDAQDAIHKACEADVLKAIVKVAGATRRETDPAGWYKSQAILGIIFTEAPRDPIVTETLFEKVHEALTAELVEESLAFVHVSVHVFADESDDQDLNGLMNPTFYPDLLHERDARRLPLLLKRVIDAVGSIVALIVLSPLFAVVALIVKVTSRGPVLFRQQRIGQFGVPFEFLKFRSMYVANDAKIHEEYVRNFIAGKGQTSNKDGHEAVYKITNDPRITPIGRLMRRTSLDELPQFWNVLKGQMSLVGPRPSVSYETEGYNVWHRRRLFEAKPGITGLWQVHGRSRTTFDEMVRLDLRYSRNWSPLVDLKILLKTPRAVLSGDGAY
jgi:lipopolysaccharide/colanic/teichoic acid biosynthesis glycosyltransferase